MKKFLLCWAKRLFGYFLGLGIACAITILGTNAWILYMSKERIVTISEVEDADCIMVLGAYVRPNGEPSSMLTDRLEKAYEVYENTNIPKVLLTGDHGQKEYDEVNSMRRFMEQKGIAKQDIFLDHAGFSTYESIYRACEIFKVHNMVIVTQEYHLPRALYMAQKLGIEAVGVAAEPYPYPGMSRYKLRECLARTKDFMLVNFIKTKPTYLGEAIPVTGDGRLSQDKD
ncbi:hypothetical protein CS063_11015 [Sporanaerobium hydrogeniformans]|uniref:Uncharacterized protein n=1 Tax=Sporanaerobium hydrogeniformans TaxID=3072179 RepID=A0AC61DCQ6_9FIRM|nr:ElyC/SanA/YdcF family protein [Sporanaerobium hydrogeniformans]PHV70401.1 hypothetical protein CS063_11015 [Sporanaerobium hydrogeniformans]